METSYLKTLELDKIVARAAEGCVCKEAREMLLATQPQCDPDEVRYALEQTDAINTLLIKNGSPRFGGVENVSQLAARAVKGGVLSMGELLMVAGALRNFQNLSSWYGAAEHDALPTDDLFYALAPQPGLEQQISSAILAPDAMADTASHTLNDLRNKMGLTIMFIAHNLSVVKYFSDRIGVMYYGKLVELADSDELFEHPLHPYTKSLLSAIPYPDPHHEKHRQRIEYKPLKEHDYSVNKPSLREIKPGHFINCNDEEFERYKKELGL